MSVQELTGRKGMAAAFLQHVRSEHPELCGRGHEPTDAEYYRCVRTFLDWLEWDPSPLLLWDSQAEAVALRFVVDEAAARRRGRSTPHGPATPERSEPDAG
jgi:hypothetical protein